MELKRYEFKRKNRLELTVTSVIGGTEENITSTLQFKVWLTDNQDMICVRHFTDRTKAENWFDRLVEMLKEE